MCKFHVMTKVGIDVGMAIGGSITISSGSGTATSGNIGVTSDEPPHDAHNDDMATENGGLPCGAMPNSHRLGFLRQGGRAGGGGGTRRGRGICSYGGGG